MMRFVFSFAAVWMAIYGWNCTADDFFLRVEWLSYGSSGLLLCFIPTLASASATMLVHTVRPRRLFDAPAKQGIKPVLFGIATGFISLGLVASVLVLMEDNANDTAILAGSSAGVTLIILLLFGGRRQCGYCRGCGYDIRASLNFGRCPDCGTAI